ncbi:hypothetical protein HZS_6877 [Henneguya salminicola]|nr:hypothetical protein HZS_6877 [Henneguya salminicola]
MKLYHFHAITNSNTINYMRENGILASRFKCLSVDKKWFWWKLLPRNPKMNKNFDAIKESVGQPDRYASNIFFSDSRLELSRILLFIHLSCKMYPIKIIEDDFTFAHQTKNHTGNRDYK